MDYFSRSYPIREFERNALAELHNRGLETAKEVVAVNDGSAWIQSFIDYHCPKAVRVIDFAHAHAHQLLAPADGWLEALALRLATEIQASAHGTEFVVYDEPGADAAMAGHFFENQDDVQGGHAPTGILFGQAHPESAMIGVLLNLGTGICSSASH